jgi:alkylation response protein AidB-like acyl-CoA dehydrogenase
VTAAAGPAPGFWRHHVDPEFADGVRRFCLEEVVPVADRLDAEDLYPTELVQKTAERGYNTLTLPRRYGGGETSMSHAASMMEELSYGSAALGVSLITIFQTQKIIEAFGQESLKQAFLPRYAQGLRTSYALTETAHGSDIRTLDTKAHRSGDGWTLEGEKAFITSGSAADLFVVLAETDVGVTTFAVPAETPGVSTYATADAETFGLRNGPHLNLVLDGVQLPDDHLIGEEGRGLRQAMFTLSNSRTLAGAISLGIARAAFDGAAAFAADREVFGKQLMELQGIQWYLAEALAKLDAARLLIYQAARDLDEGHEIARSSSEAKLFASEVATEIAGMAVQVCGARGTMMSASFGRYLRDAKTYEIAGGSSEVLKNTIAKAVSAAYPKSTPEAE